MEMANQKTMGSAKEHKQHYKKLFIMAVLSFISMYILMYSMVNRVANVVPNVNEFYMAGLIINASYAQYFLQRHYDQNH